ncbi:hypothetical protein [Zoogloea sp.]|uniref:hypothetical protein n=1 Tax=Zoogloea sp. TaxID=49181 RepID=UPI001AC4AE9F|nr:hypothetical protein [Zoogloea sp.]MBN8282731.1 hypothetical protein [Zoogloea sp.]
MKDFLCALQTQRWDDHRFYHHSRVNQTLHLISAISFLIAYSLLFVDPVKAALIGWLISMVTRQSGHFFFEPLGYDEENKVSNEYKEAVKVGYNLKRKVVLLSIWAFIPPALWLNPTMFGLFDAHTDMGGYIDHLGILWLSLGVGGLLFRTVHLFFIRDVQTGLVWLTKILTDPYHDIKLYHRAPLLLLRDLRAREAT